MTWHKKNILFSASSRLAKSPTAYSERVCLDCVTKFWQPWDFTLPSRYVNALLFRFSGNISEYAGVAPFFTIFSNRMALVFLYLRWKCNIRQIKDNEIYHKDNSLIGSSNAGLHQFATVGLTIQDSSKLGCYFFN